MSFPKNILVLATHGSYSMPFYLKFLLTPDFKRNKYRLLKNCSDFGTRLILPSGIPKNQVLVCPYSRILGDPNRGSSLFRTVDFNQVKIWRISLPLFLKKFLVRNFYLTYHRNIAMLLSTLEKKYGKVIILDIHDTGNVLLAPSPAQDISRKPSFPHINLSNYEHKASSQEFLLHLSSLFEQEFKIKPVLNKPYKGGYVTQKYGIGHNREVVQVEFNRSLYLDERTQSVKKEQVLLFRKKLFKVLSKL